LVFLAAILPAWLHGGNALAGPQQATVGVLAYRGDDTCLQMWGPTIEYLNEAIRGTEFRLAPLDLDEMSVAVRQGKVDFVLTNPGNYVELERWFGITRIATLKNLRHGKPSTAFGAVIFTAADRADIRELSDLRSKSFGAVSEAVKDVWDAYGIGLVLLIIILVLVGLVMKRRSRKKALMVDGEEDMEEGSQNGPPES